MILIEEPIPDDAAEIFFVQRQTWHESYLDQVSHEDIEKRFVDAPEKIKRIKQVIEGKIDGKFFVAREKELDKILGFISFLTEPRNEIKSLYMIQASQGLGLGRKLLEKALQWYGEKDIYVQTNNAQSFYEKFGFTRIKQVPDPEGYFLDMTELIRPAS